MKQEITAADLARLAGEMAATAYQERKSCPHWQQNYPDFLAKIRAANTGTLIEALGMNEFMPIEDRAPYMHPLREVVFAEIERKNTERLANAGTVLTVVGIVLALVQAAAAARSFFM